MGGSARRLAVLGSTGSIGTQTLAVVRSLAGRFQVVALGARRATPLLAAQVQEFSPSLVAFQGPAGPLGGAPQGAERVDLAAMASHPDVDMVVIAIPGLAALEPTLAALAAGKPVALASKEVLVAAGDLVMAEARRGATLLPLDSEHSALWQCLLGEDAQSVASLTLTASGGPFRSRAMEQMQGVTPAEALAHPTWRMGPKVTVDSATLMNKGFEVMEAHWLFGVPYARIQVVVHPQSIVHSLIEFVDGSVKAQLSVPDMRLPIQYALTYPERAPAAHSLARLDLAATGALTFQPLDESRFPCYRLAREAAERGGTYPAVLSAADEEAVALFLAGRIPYLAIPRLVEETLAEHDAWPEHTLEAVQEADAWARRSVREAVWARL